MLVALVAAAAIAALAATPRTAQALSCEKQQLSDYADDVTVAFLGHVISRTYEDGLRAPPPVLVLQVIWVYKGDVGPTIEVSDAGGPAYGMGGAGRPSTGIVAFGTPNELEVKPCFSVVAVDDLREVFGYGYPPNKSIQLQDPDNGSASVGAPADGDGRYLATEDAPDNGSASVWALAGGLAAIVAATIPTLWMLVARRRARRSPPAPDPGEEGA